MPLVRIDLHKSAPAERAHIAGDAIYEAMHTLANVPANDKFQIITRHDAGELVFPAEGYLGIDYTPDIIMIQITWNAGRSVEVKKAFYKAVASSISARAGIRPQDVWINLVEVAKENWSFGNGEMQYGPADA
jgi:phenylpyruvate tautomerase PptA (4-oxalocrotonate tautomerase family)